MAGINVREQIIQEFTDSFNNKICEGNFLLVSMDRGKKEENILCIFKGAKGPYLVTSTVDGKTMNQYRLNSVKKCQVVESIKFKEEDGK